MAIANLDGRAFWGRYFPKDNMVRWLLFEGALEQNFQDAPEVLGLKAKSDGEADGSFRGGFGPTMGVNTKLPDEWEHSSFGRNFAMGDENVVMLPGLKRVLLADSDNTTVFKLDQIFRATGFEDLKTLVKHFAPKIEEVKRNDTKTTTNTASTASLSDIKADAGPVDGLAGLKSSEDERVFFIHVRDSSAPFNRVDDYKSRGGFAMVTSGTTLAALRKLIREAHGMELDDGGNSVAADSDDEDDDEDEDLIEFLRDNKFNFAIKTTVDGSTEYMKVTKKQEKTFVLKDLTCADICVFESSAARRNSSKESTDTSPSKAAVPGSVADKYNADEQQLIEVCPQNIVTDPKLVEAMELEEKIERLVKKSERDWAKNLTVDKVIHDEQLSHELRAYVATGGEKGNKSVTDEEGGRHCEEAEILFLQKLKRTEDKLKEKYLKPLFVELEAKRNEIKNEFLSDESKTRVKNCFFSDKRADLFEHADENSRFDNIVDNLYKRFVAPEFAGFKEAKTACETRLEGALTFLKLMQKSSPFQSLKLQEKAINSNTKDQDAAAEKKRVADLRSRPKKIVIIGAGMAGSILFRMLSWMEGKNSEKVEVILVDLKDYAENTPGVLRMMAQPDKLVEMTINKMLSKSGLK